MLTSFQVNEFENFITSEAKRLFAVSYFNGYNVSMTESPSESLRPATGNLTILFVEETEDKSLKINWMDSNLIPTIIHPEGEEADMYRFLKGKFKTPRDSAGASVAISSDENGIPQEIGERGGVNWVKRIKPPAP